jgi:hypothetical protein
LSARVEAIRAEDPKRFALFTGPFARQFGTPNYAAHGGSCSVNMAAGLICAIGGSFCEFGGLDLDLDPSKLFVMIGAAEDHHSNPSKIATSKFKRRGGRFVSINPTRTGYSALANAWVPGKPDTDAALPLAIIQQILKQGFYLIREELPPNECGEHILNSIPVTGQATWFDVRVRVYKASADEPKVTAPQVPVMPRPPGQERRRGRWQAYVAGLFHKQ